MRTQNLAIMTGCNGFTGRYLVSFLRKRRKAFKIVGIDVHSKSKVDVDVYVKSNLKKKFPKAITKEIEKAGKVFCFHLAGMIFEKDSEKIFSNNLSATENTFISLVPYKEKTVVVNIGSSAEYGYHGRKGITEKCVANPVSKYGSSKLHQTKIAQHFSKKYGLPIVMIRTFNMIGPGQTEKLVCGRMVKQVVNYKRGLTRKVVVLGSETYRDFIDVRDVVRGYVLLAEEGKPGELYNIASGKGIKIGKALDIILKISRINPEITEKTQDNYKQDIPYQKASISKVKREIGWQPLITFEKSIKDMINLEMKRAGK